jgi:hypothetical protein
MPLAAAAALARLLLRTHIPAFELGGAGAGTLDFVALEHRKERATGDAQNLGRFCAIAA